MNVTGLYGKSARGQKGASLKDQVRLQRWPWIFGLYLLSVLTSLVEPPVLLAGPPNVVISQAIHFPTLKGNPVTLSPGKYLVQQAGPQELRMTAVADKQEFLIQAQALTHEQYELFSPMALSRPNKNHAFLIDLYLPGGVKLEARGSSKELPTPPPEEPQTPQLIETPEPSFDAMPPSETSQVPAILPDPPPPTLPQNPPILDPPSAPVIIEETPSISYQTPYPNQPGLRIDGSNPEGQFPSIFVLAPQHVGQTSQEYPVFFWYLSHSTQDPLDVMVAEEGNLEALLDIRLLPPLQAGIHELRLEDYGISLIPEVPYRWTVRIMNSQASEYLTASGAIQRINAPVVSSSSLVYSPEDYAQKGLWYDALTSLQTLIQDNPGNSDLLAQRTSLLKQGGLTEVATFFQQAQTP